MAAKKKGEKKPERKMRTMDQLVEAADAALAGKEDADQIVWHPTGFVTLDNVLANGQDIPGGFPGGRLVHLYGNSSAGKTTLAAQSSVPIQKKGKIVLVLDFEETFTRKYARTLGLDTTPVEEGGNYLQIQPENMEHGIEILLGALTNEGWKDRIGAVIWDSVAASKSDHNKDSVYEHNRLGLEASQWSTHLPRIIKALAKTDAVMFLINQTRIDPSAGLFGDPETTGGGTAIKFYSTIMIGLRRSEKIETPMLNPFTGAIQPMKSGYRVFVRIDKNKITGELDYQSFIPLTDNAGFDNVWDCIEHAKNLDLVQTKSGGWFTLPAGMVDDKEHSIQTVPKLRKFLNEDEARAKAFCDAVDAKIRENFKTLQEMRASARGLDFIIPGVTEDEPAT